MGINMNGSSEKEAFMGSIFPNADIPKLENLVKLFSPNESKYSVGRTAEVESIRRHFESCLGEFHGGIAYLSGASGVGKTLVATTVASLLCLEYPDLLYDKAVSVSAAGCDKGIKIFADIVNQMNLDTLQQRKKKLKDFKLATDKGRISEVVKNFSDLVKMQDKFTFCIIDEIDFVATHGQKRREFVKKRSKRAEGDDFLQYLVSAATDRNSRLLVIAISNSAELVKHINSSHFLHVVFAPYTESELESIIRQKLSSLATASPVISNTALKLFVRRVANYSGDCRYCFDGICRGIFSKIWQIRQKKQEPDFLQDARKRTLSELPDLESHELQATHATAGECFKTMRYTEEKVVSGLKQPSPSLVTKSHKDKLPKRPLAAHDLDLMKLSQQASNSSLFSGDTCSPLNSNETKNKEDMSLSRCASHGSPLDTPNSSYTESTNAVSCQQSPCSCNQLFELESEDTNSICFEETEGPSGAALTAPSLRCNVSKDGYDVQKVSLDSSDRTDKAVKIDQPSLAPPDIGSCPTPEARPLLNILNRDVQLHSLENDKKQALLNSKIDVCVQRSSIANCRNSMYASSHLDIPELDVATINRTTGLLCANQQQLLMDNLQHLPFMQKLYLAAACRAAQGKCFQDENSFDMHNSKSSIEVGIDELENCYRALCNELQNGHVADHGLGWSSFKNAIDTFVDLGICRTKTAVLQDSRRFWQPAHFSKHRSSFNSKTAKKLLSIEMLINPSLLETVMRKLSPVLEGFDIQRHYSSGMEA